MAQKKITKRRSSTKKKMSPLLKILIGGAVLGGGYLIYDQFFAKKDDPSKAAADAAAAAQAAAESERAAAALNAIDSGKQAPITAILPDWLDPSKEDKRTLSKIGTPGTKQNWGLVLFKGDKGGEIETLQYLFNRISKAYGKTGIKVDGDFGTETEKKRIAIVGIKPGITLAQVYKLVKSVEASKQIANSTPNWDPFGMVSF